MMDIRDGVESDLPHLVTAIKDFVGSSSYRTEPVDVAHVTETLRTLMHAKDGVVAVMRNDKGIFAGCFVGMAHAHLFSSNRMLAELFIYTTPDARGHGNKLRRFAEDWARDNECKAFLIAHPMSEMHLQRVYGRWGFKPHEVHYWKDLV